MPTDEQRRLLVGILVVVSGGLLASDVLPEFLGGHNQLVLAGLAVAAAAWVALGLPGYQPRPKVHLPPGVQRPIRELTLRDRLTFLAIVLLVALGVLVIVHEVKPYPGGYGAQVVLAVVYVGGLLGGLLYALWTAARRVWRWLRRKHAPLSLASHVPTHTRAQWSCRPLLRDSPLLILAHYPAPITLAGLR